MVLFDSGGLVFEVFAEPVVVALNAFRVFLFPPFGGGGPVVFAGVLDPEGDFGIPVVILVTEHFLDSDHVCLHADLRFLAGSRWPSSVAVS